MAKELEGHRRLVVSGEPLRPGSRRLGPSEAKYLAKVLRLKPGERLSLYDGLGHQAGAEITELSPKSALLWLEAPSQHRREGPYIRLWQAVIRPDKLDLLVRHATELGASEIAWVMSERSQGGFKPKDARLWAIIDDALRVSGRLFRPEMRAPVPFKALLEAPRADRSLMLTERSSKPALLALSKLPAQLEILIGPEGGLSPREEAEARAAGFEAVTLGSHTLRAETAALAALAVVSAAFHAEACHAEATPSAPQKAQTAS